LQGATDLRERFCQDSRLSHVVVCLDLQDGLISAVSDVRPFGTLCFSAQFGNLVQQVVLFPAQEFSEMFEVRVIQSCI
jgi:hypothetical protein